MIIDPLKLIDEISLNDLNRILTIYLMQCSCGKTYKREQMLSKHESICKYNILWNENKRLKLELENKDKDKDKDKVKMRINSDTSWIKISNKQCLL